MKHDWLVWGVGFGFFEGGFFLERKGKGGKKNHLPAESFPFTTKEFRFSQSELTFSLVVTNTYKHTQSFGACNTPLAWSLS